MRGQGREAKVLEAGWTIVSRGRPAWRGRRGAGSRTAVPLARTDDPHHGDARDLRATAASFAGRQVRP
jgi:hypothetical protein